MRRAAGLIALVIGLSAAAAAPAGDALVARPAAEPLLVVVDATLPPRHDFTLRLALVGALGPGGDRPLIDGQVAASLGASLGLTRRLAFVVDAPVLWQPRADALSPESTVGDPRFGLRFALVQGAVSLAARLDAWAPLGDERAFAGNAGWTLEPGVVVTNDAGRLRIGGAVSARLRGAGLDDAAAPTLRLGSELALGGGFVYAVAPRLGVGAEVVALLPVGSDKTACPSESCSDGDAVAYALVGARLAAGGGASLTLAGGLDLAGGARGPGLFGGLVLGFTPVGTTSSGALDTDRDGLPDAFDSCPTAAEDGDRFAEPDGCPDVDHDSDGVGVGDACPANPEDRDGFADEDGCPDADNDGDKVPDGADRCAAALEDPDGFEDRDGCPDADNDGDGVPDTGDGCPDEPENINGAEDEDGCPEDPAPGVPFLAADRIGLGGAVVGFAGAAPDAAGAELLGRIAKVMRAFPRVRFRVEVHVERSGAGKGDRDKDRARAAARAAAVAAALVAAGVPAAQIEAVGLGSDLLLDAAAPSAAKNARVDFVRVDQ